MGRRPFRWKVAAAVALGAALVVVQAANVAQAKPWAKWAPDPLASDSSYAALSARPADSLSVNELAWVGVQRDWRAQRRDETLPGGTRIAAAGGPHHVRPDDRRFAALASRPYPSLDEDERMWLVMENSAQRADRANEGQVGRSVGFMILGIAGGVVLGTYLVLHAIFDTHS